MIVFVALFLISRVESYELKKIHTLVKENNDILKGDYKHDAKNKIQPEFGSLLAVIPEWGPNWKISFDLFIHSFDNGDKEYGSILRFTDKDKDEDTSSTDPFDNGNLGVGRRIPALFTRNCTVDDDCYDYECDYNYPDYGYTGVQYATNLDSEDHGINTGNNYTNSPCNAIQAKKWYSFEIEQNFEEFEWITRLKANKENGKNVWTVKLVVPTPNVYYNVSVFAGDLYFNAADVKIKNLQYSSGTSSFAYP